MSERSHAAKEWQVVNQYGPECVVAGTEIREKRIQLNAGQDDCWQVKEQMQSPKGKDVILMVLRKVPDGRWDDQVIE